MGVTVPWATDSWVLLFARISNPSEMKAEPQEGNLPERPARAVVANTPSALENDLSFPRHVS